MKLIHTVLIALILICISCEKDKVLEVEPTGNLKIAALNIEIISCKLPTCFDPTPIKNQLVRLFKSEQEAAGNSNFLKEDRTNEKGEVDFAFFESQVVYIRIELNDQVYINQENLIVNSLSYHPVEFIKDCKYQNNKELSCEFYNVVFRDKINYFKFFYNSKFDTKTQIYTEDTLIIDIIKYNQDGSFTIRERFNDCTDEIKAYYAYCDHEFVYNLWVDSNKKLFIEPLNGDIAYSHIFHIDELSFSSQDIRNIDFQLRQTSFNEFERIGSQHLPVIYDLGNLGYILNEKYLNENYDSLNVLLEYSAFSSDGFGKTYIYSGKYGIVQTSKTPGFWPPPITRGFTLITE